MNKTRPYLCHLITSLEVGGCQQVLLHLVAGLRGEFSQEVVYFRHGPTAIQLTKLGIKLIHIRGLMWTYDPIFWVRLYKHLNTQRPNCIHALLWSANAVAKLLHIFIKIPVVCAIHSPANTSKGTNSWLRTKIDHVLAGQVAHTIAINQTIKKNMRCTSVIKNTIDTDAIDQHIQMQRITRANLGLSTDNFVIGAVGRLVELKRQEDLLYLMHDLMPIYPHLRLIVIGTGPLYNHLIDLANKLHINKFVLIKSAHPAYAYYQIFDLLVQPSCTEGLSLALLEAMYLRITPLVASPDGYHTVVTHGINGWLYNPDLADDLAKWTAHAIKHRAELIHLALAAQKYVLEHHNPTDMIQAYTAIFKTSQSCQSSHY